MVTKEEVRNYYADKHDKRDLETEDKICPEFVTRCIANMDEDETGIYTLLGELLGEREYYTLDEVKTHINGEIEAHIKDLVRILNY